MSTSGINRGVLTLCEWYSLITLLFTVMKLTRFQKAHLYLNSSRLHKTFVFCHLPFPSKLLGSHLHTFLPSCLLWRKCGFFLFSQTWILTSSRALFSLLLTLLPQSHVCDSHLSLLSSFCFEYVLVLPFPYSVCHVASVPGVQGPVRQDQQVSGLHSLTLFPH